eukprot:1269627-Prymnesium_polylepis.1
MCLRTSRCILRRPPKNTFAHCGLRPEFAIWAVMKNTELECGLWRPRGSGPPPSRGARPVR